MKELKKYWWSIWLLLAFKNFVVVLACQEWTSNQELEIPDGAIVVRWEYWKRGRKIAKKLRSLAIMEKHGLVPDVIDTLPSAVVEVSYGSAKVNLGNELTPTAVQKAPTVKWQADDGSFYTLCMTDPDAPSRKEPIHREWHHWLVGNIPGGNVAQGETLSAYVGSGPPQGTGLHRYVFLVYKQPGKLTFDEKRLTNTSGDNRGAFSIRGFAKKHGLGEPVAGNLYQAQWDDYVPKLYAQLSGK